MPLCIVSIASNIVSISRGAKYDNWSLCIAVLKPSLFRYGAPFEKA